MTAADLSPPESKIGALRAILLALLEEHERDDALPTSTRFSTTSWYSAAN
jgi:hypothetical protein